MQDGICPAQVAQENAPQAFPLQTAEISLNTSRVSAHFRTKSAKAQTFHSPKSYQLKKVQSTRA